MHHHSSLAAGSCILCTLTSLTLIVSRQSQHPSRIGTAAARLRIWRRSRFLRLVVDSRLWLRLCIEARLPVRSYINRLTRVGALASSLLVCFRLQLFFNTPPSRRTLENHAIVVTGVQHSATFICTCFLLEIASVLSARQPCATTALSTLPSVQRSMYVVSFQDYTMSNSETSTLVARHPQTPGATGKIPLLDTKELNETIEEQTAHQHGENAANVVCEAHQPPLWLTAPELESYPRYGRWCTVTDKLEGLLRSSCGVC